MISKFAITVYDNDFGLTLETFMRMFLCDDRKWWRCKDGAWFNPSINSEEEFRDMVVYEANIALPAIYRIAQNGYKDGLAKSESTASYIKLHKDRVFINEEVDRLAQEDNNSEVYVCDFVNGSVYNI